MSLELGGSNSLRNLWPQSYVTEPLNAHVKDRLENRLHELVCARKLSLEEAQKSIASDWTKAYIHYVGPLPQGTGEASASLPSAGVKRNPDGSCPPSAPVKVSRSGLYHVPGDSSYARTKAKVCFASARRAKAAGYRAPKR